MTRSSVQLSLYGPVDNLSSKTGLETLLRRHNLTTTVFGELQDKQAILKANSKPKQVQLIFTVHTKKHREGKVNDVKTSFNEAKIQNMTRQVQFAQYFINNLQELQPIKSCRFMLVDNRICKKLFKLINSSQQEEVQANEVLEYRSYLFTLQQKSHMIIQFKNQMYIKFPKEYAIIRSNGDGNGDGNGNEYETGKIELSDKEYTYGTCFDTRTYSCLHYKQRLKADSEEMMKIITALTGPKRVIPWPSTNDLTADCNKFILKNQENKTLLAYEVNSVIYADSRDEHTASLSVDEQKHMYTLPDFFTTEEPKYDILRQSCVTQPTKAQESWTQNVDKNFDEKGNNAIDKWISLRCTTKYITCEKASSILDISEVNLRNNLLRKILEKIRTNINTT